MTMLTQFVERQLSNALKGAQDKCIGLFKPWYGDNWELVMELEYEVVITISIGGLFALFTEHMPASSGKLVLFPDGKSLTDMLSNPYEWLEWYHNNIENA